MQLRPAAIAHQHAAFFLRHKYPERNRAVYPPKKLTYNPGAWVAACAGFLGGALASWVLLGVYGYLEVIVPILTSRGLISVGLWVLILGALSVSFRLVTRYLRNTAF